ncbi:hypothetical protein D3C86_1675740 [compost metagenome]
MIGVYKITGSLNFESRVERFMTDIPPARPTLTAIARVDENGRYSVSVPDTGEESFALVLFAWEDSDNDGQWLGYVERIGWEVLAGKYVFYRTSKGSGFNENQMYGSRASRDSSNFEF